MAVIKSGASTDQLTIDPTSKAARVSIYASDGTYVGQKATYRASTIGTITVVSGTAPFFTIYGSATKTIRIRRIWYSATIATAAANVIILVSKRSSTPTGGTSTALTMTNVDSNDAAATATNVQVYTAAPTAGTLVGTLETRRANLLVTGAVATPDLIFDFTAGGNDNIKAAVLRGTAQGIDLSYQTAPGNTTAVTITVEWTEE